MSMTNTFTPAPPGTGAGINPGGAAQGVGTSPPTGTPSAQTDAMGLLQNELDAWGLGQLASWAWQEIVSGKSTDQIIYDLRQTDTYKSSIFGQTNAIRQASGLSAMDETTILSYKDQASQMARAAGLPAGYITDQEIAHLAGMNVSAAELNTRINVLYEHASQAPDDYRAELAKRGIDTGHLAAYYDDPNRALPFLKQQEASADISVAAQRSGVNGVDIATADQLAAQGITEAQAKSGMANVASLNPLYRGLPGSGEADISTQVALGAEFEGNAADKQAIQQRQESRIAAFRGGGRFGENTKGIQGIGQATSA